MALALLLEAAFSAFLPFCAAFLVDHAVVGKDRDSLALMLVLLGGGFAVSLLAVVFRVSLWSKMQSRALALLRQHMFDRLQVLSLSFHAAHEPEEVLDTFSGLPGVIEAAYSLTPSQAALPLAESLVYSGVALWLDWRVGLLSLLLWPWIALAPKAFAKQVGEASENCRDEEVRILSVVEESLTATTVIKSFSLEHLGVALFRKRNDLLQRAARRSVFFTAWMDRFTQSGVLFIQIMILALGALLAFDDRMSPGKLVGIPILTWLLAQSLQRVSEYLPALDAAKLAWARILEGMRDPSPVYDKTDAKALAPLKNEISFTDVSFSYGDEPALDRVTARVKRGTHAAFVGLSGSGNRIPLTLLMRFHDPSGGTIAFDGVDLKTVAQASVRTRVALLQQDNFIFHASIRENIRLGHPDASEERLRDVVRNCGIDELSPELPRGLDTTVGENGTRISGETTQRLALARALLRNPDLLMLDDYAAALDPAEEAAVGQTLREIAKDRTVISATHRLSSVADADAIFVFDRRKVVEHGTHAELMALEGFYAALWRKQSGLRISPDGLHVDVDAERLRQAPALEKLDLEVLAELVPCLVTETFGAGREILRQNDPGDRVYILVRGTAEVWGEDEETGEPVVTAILQDGDSFGENALIEKALRPATVRATAVSTCVSLGRSDYERVLARVRTAALG
jgi:ATP-binding cassette subfamily B protein